MLEKQQYVVGNLYDISKINKYLDRTDYDWSKFPKLFSAVRRERFLGDQKTAISADPKYNVGKLIEFALKDKKSKIHYYSRLHL